MRVNFLIGCALLLLLAGGCGQKVDDPADLQAVRQVLDEYGTAVNAEDAAAAAALMTERTVYAGLDAPAFVGKDAIRAMHQMWFDAIDVEFSAPVTELRVVGDLGVAWGTWKDSGAPKAKEMAAIRRSGNWTSVLERQSDGTWKFQSLTVSSDQAPLGRTASRADEAALLQIERDWMAAAQASDLQAFERILASDFVSVEEGQPYMKKHYLADLKSGALKFESATMGDLQAIALGEVGITQGTTSVKATYKGKDMSGRYRWTDVFAKRDGNWQCVYSYSTKAE